MRVCLETFYSATLVAIVTSSVLTLTDNFDILRQAPCKRTQHCWMFYAASVCTPFCTLLLIVGSCCAKLEIGQIFEPKKSRHFFCSVIAEAWRNNVRFVWTLLGQRTRITPWIIVMDNRKTIIHDYTWSPKSYGIYPSHDALQVPT